VAVEQSAPLPYQSLEQFVRGIGGRPGGLLTELPRWGKPRTRPLWIDSEAASGAG
jgi:hypothetical protein